jgi:hypothetical protein
MKFLGLKNWVSCRFGERAVVHQVRNRNAYSLVQCSRHARANACILDGSLVHLTEQKAEAQ